MKTDLDERGTMYILGAGASIGSDRVPHYDDLLRNRRMPSGENFFHDLHYSEREFNSGFHFMNMLGAMYEGLDKLIHQTYKIDSETSFFDERHWVGLNIESVFTHLDIGTKMYSKGSAYRKVFVQSKESLVSYVTLALIMRSAGQRCNNLGRIFKRLADRDTVLSFNWDTIADVTLEYLGKPHFDNYVELITKKVKPNALYARPAYLKLHGSLNWGVCRNRKCLNKDVNVFINSKSGKLGEMDLRSYQNCIHCGGVLEINIIPPVSEKIDIHKSNLFSAQWNIARRKLQSSKRLVFIGYSFPATDSYAEWLFRQINYLVESIEPLKFALIDIHVVNPAAMPADSALRQRYNSIFKGHEIKYFKSIEDYTGAV